MKPLTLHYPCFLALLTYVTFRLDTGISGGCAIPDYTGFTEEVIITGGQNKDETNENGTFFWRKEVSVYDESGWLRSLAPMNQGRSYHGCTSFTQSQGLERV